VTPDWADTSSRPIPLAALLTTQAMRDRALITTRVAGGALAAICCATPLLAIAFGAVGLTAWLAKADYVLIPALIICLGLIGVGLFRRRVRQDGAHG
jgi:mercuric ion transport protein